MIYNARNRSNDATENLEGKRSVLVLIFSSQSKITGLNKMWSWSLKSLAMLKCNILYAVQYK